MDGQTTARQSILRSLPTLEETSIYLIQYDIDRGSHTCCIKEPKTSEVTNEKATRQILVGIDAFSAQIKGDDFFFGHHYFQSHVI